MNISSLIDHTNLKPDCSQEDVDALCREAVFHQFATVCIPPYHVKHAQQLLEGETVKVATVIGFPMGYSATPSKVEEIKRALDDGADEVDVVVNVCAIKSEQWNYVRNDIDSMTRAVHLKGKTIKVIIEAGLLTEAEIRKVCAICESSGVNYVKNSSGINGGAASPELISFLRQLLPDKIKLKASGGIRTAEQARALIAAGASRLGSSSGLAICAQ